MNRLLISYCFIFAARHERNGREPHPIHAATRQVGFQPKGQQPINKNLPKLLL